MRKKINAIMLAVLVVGTVAPRADTAPQTINEVVTWMADRLAALEAVEQTATMSIQLVFEDREEKTEEERLLVFQRPNHFRVASDMHILVADETYLSIAFPELGYFMKLPLTDELTVVIEEQAEMVAAMVLPDVAALWARDPAVALQALIATLESEGLTFAVKGWVEYEDRPALHLRITDKREHGMLADGLDAWIDAETGLIAGLSAEIDFSAMQADFGATAPGWPARYHLEYRTQFVTVNTPVTESRFTLDTDGWEQVADFDELADRMQAATERSAGREWVGTPAPDFELTLLDGEVFRLADQRGRVVLIDFWATWCPPCVESLPYLQALYADLPEDQVVFLGISLDRSTQRDRVQAMWEQFDIRYKVGINAGGDIATAYEVFSIPTLLIVDAEGIIRYQKVGFSPEQMAEVRTTLTQLLDAADGSPKLNE